MQTEFAPPFNFKHYYRIISPAGNHLTFRIAKTDNSRSFKMVNHPSIRSLNSQYLNGEISFQETKANFFKLRWELYRLDGVPIQENKMLDTNLETLEAYWESEYVPRLVRLIDPATARFEFNRAIQALGVVCIRTASRNELQAQVNRIPISNKHRRVVAKLNLILKFLKREFRLLPAREQYPEVKHVSLSEFKSLIFATFETAIFHRVAFATGARQGEIFAFEPNLYNRADRTIKILHQIDRFGRKRETKNRKPRTAFVLPEFEDDLFHWYEIKRTFPRALGERMNRYTRKASKAAFPDQPTKHITLHDLRHSYAIHLLGLGVPISQVAQCLGDSVAVAEKFYVGHDLSAGSVQLINQIVKSKA